MMFSRMNVTTDLFPFSCFVHLSDVFRICRLRQIRKTRCRCSIASTISYRSNRSHFAINCQGTRTPKATIFCLICSFSKLAPLPSRVEIESLQLSILRSASCLVRLTVSRRDKDAFEKLLNIADWEKWIHKNQRFSIICYLHLTRLRCDLENRWICNII